MANDEIKQYWNQRAAESSHAATTNDLHLRGLEAAALVAQLQAFDLPKEPRILDIGCGDGETTAAISRRFPSASIQGMDFSAEMLTLAKQKSGSDRVTFSVGDVRNLTSQFAAGAFDAIITNRCLINLPHKDEQYDALKQIAECLVPGGHYIGTENFTGGQASLTELRSSISLPEIPVRWHNVYFNEAEFIEKASELFRDVELINFSSTYYLVTRVVYSALCKSEGIEPGYEHPLYAIGAALPPIGDFSPIKLIRARV
jgi:ubiquinone/menaquinone biosynthesis C-methylase UbiE